MIRLLAVEEEWGIYCGAVAVDPRALNDLPAKCANKVRVLIRNSPWPGFLVRDLGELTAQASRNGLTELPLSLYRPGRHKGQRWRHETLSCSPRVAR